jgi:diguanylate cyclase (GGDEF)-like protein
MFGLGSEDTRIRRQLVSVLHSRPIGIVIGSASGVAVAAVALASDPPSVLRWTLGLMALFAASRAISSYGSRSLDNAFGRFLHRTYWMGARGYAATAGLAAGLSLVVSGQAHVQILLVAFALTFGAGISIGNACRPMVTLTQISLTLVPIAVGALLTGSIPLMTLALVLCALSIALGVMTMNIASTLVEQQRSTLESKDLAAQMQEFARTDQVTRLANRTGFEAMARDQFCKAAADRVLALLWIDLHRFKDVNDTLGHETGDVVLVEVGKRLCGCTPPDAIVARFGSDEFVVLADLDQRNALDVLATQISDALEQPMTIFGHRINGGASIGVSLKEDGMESFDRLMQHADLALYDAKLAGRGTVSFFTERMTRNLVRRKELEAELRSAIQRDELSIYFQPIIDLASGEIRAFEALVRWFHPTKGELLPQEFIPVAEETGLIITLGNWVTRHAAKVAANWPEHVRLCVNLSPLQIRAPGAALGILAAIRDAGLDASRLELEVTESLFLDDDAETALFLEQLSLEGVQFALDDFGTGYSSLHYIRKYPFRTIKVDRSFVSVPGVDKRSDAIIRAVASMGETLGLDIVAEGLETAEQVRAVRSAGCTLGQGYHFSGAVPEHLARKLLDDETACRVPTRLAG